MKMSDFYNVSFAMCGNFASLNQNKNERIIHNSHNCLSHSKRFFTNRFNN